MANVCTQCGHPLKETNKYCPFCGAPVQASPVLTEEGTPREVEDPASEHRRTGRRLLGIIGAVIVLVAGGLFVTHLISRNNARNELYKKMAVYWSEKASGDVVELTWYVNGRVDPLQYAEVGYPITAEPAMIDVSVAGDTQVTFTVTAEDEKAGTVVRTYTKTFTVKDRIAPKVSFADDPVVIEAGSEFDPASNIEMVKDDKDGELQYRQERTDEQGTAYYTWTINGNLNEAGSHYVEVYAVDAAGNDTVAFFQIQVNGQ